MKNIRITCPNPKDRLSHGCEINGGQVEITSSAPIAVVGPLTHPLFAIPCEAARFSIGVSSDVNKTVDVLPFSLLVLPAGTQRVAYNGEAELILISLRSNQIHPGLVINGEGYYERRHSDILNTVKMLRRHLISNNQPSADYVDACVRLLTYQVDQKLDHDGRKHRVRLDDREWQELLSMIDDRLDQSITVAELADTLGLSPSQCSRAFKATVGYPPQEYIRERKLSRARELLQSTANSLAEVALASGFCSQAHMTATFTRMLGVTPARYRRDAEAAAG